jgi:LacI family transcriptional regulator
MTTQPPTRKRHVTLKDVALHAQVNAASVSAVLNGAKLNTSVAPKTRERILIAAQELGYQANQHAQRLAAGGCTNTVAIFMGMDLGIATLKLWALQHVLNEHGYEAELHGKPRYIAQAGEYQVAQLQRLVGQRPRAIIFTPYGLEEEALDVLRRYQDDGGTLICFDAESDFPCDQVIYDEEDGGYQAAKHLIQLGHERIGYCQHSSEGEIIGARFQGFNRALQEAGLKARRDWLFTHCCYEAGGTRFAREFLQLHERPTAIIIVNDMAAAAFVHALLREGERVPNLVSVIGQDGIAAAEHCVVPLSTVAQPVEELAARTVNMLDHRLKTPGAKVQRVKFTGQLIARASTSVPHSAVPARSSPVTLK